jgi:nicotinate-nucleotide pyrophosphorylase (carboxylating)
VGRVTRLLPGTATALRVAGLNPDRVSAVLTDALAEDLAYGPDLTTRATVAAGTVGTGDVLARSGGVIAGLPVAAALLELSSEARLTVQPHTRDGEPVTAGQPVLSVTGPLTDLLTAERSMLNLLGHLSGIATLTRAWVDAVAGTAARIRDTRKTLPGLRALEKYAVRCGGGRNHRMGLGDQALIKDNHVAAAGGVAEALHAVRTLAPGMPVEVECDTLAQVAEALAAGATLILLDNMSPAQIRSAVQLTAGAAELEASGALSLNSAAEVARTGVDYLAVGALTHSAPALDLGLDLRAD